jgi:branched-chain amino acid transport system permease protein
MATATGVYHTTYRSDLALRDDRADVSASACHRRRRGGTVRAEPVLADVVNQIGIAIVGAIGLNILTGHTGLISLGQGAFLGVGAYTTAILVTRFDAPTVVGVVGAVVVTAAVGTFFGLPSLRLKGLYLAMATLAAQFILLFAFRNWEFVTGGTDAIVVPPRALRLDAAHGLRLVLGDHGGRDAVVLGARNLFRTGLGRAFHAVRDQDIAAAVMGIDVGRHKLLAFAISSGWSGSPGRHDRPLPDDRDLGAVHARRLGPVPRDDHRRGARQRRRVGLRGDVHDRAAGDDPAVRTQRARHPTRR